MCFQRGYIFNWLVVRSSDEVTVAGGHMQICCKVGASFGWSQDSRRGLVAMFDTVLCGGD